MSAAQSEAESALQRCLDEYAHQQRNEDELATALTTICADVPQATWQGLSLLDQYHRRRVLGTALFRELKKRLTDIAFGGAGAHVSADGRTLARDSTSMTEGVRTPSQTAARTASSSERMETVARVDSQESTAWLDDAPVAPASAPAPEEPYVDPTTPRDRSTARMLEPTRADYAPARTPAGEPLQTSTRSTAHTVGSMTRHAARIGTTLDDRYMLIEPIVSGHISVVYKALDKKRMALPEAERYVAVKCPQEALRGDPRVVAAFKYEYTQAQSILHANIAKTFDFHGSTRDCYIVMELLQGESLDRLFERIAPRRLPTSRALTIVREIGHALAFAHDHSVVHGNLQPSNITITPAGELRVSDFAQSAGWLPPDTPPPQPADDLYGLACIAHELLCGRPPDPNSPPRDTRPDYARHLSPQQWRTLRSGLQETTALKNVSVRRWLAELDLQQADIRLPPLAVLESEVAQDTRKRQRTVLVAAVVGAATAIVAAFGVTAFLSSHSSPRTSTEPPIHLEPALPNTGNWDGEPSASPDQSTLPAGTGTAPTNDSTDSAAPSGTLPKVTFAADRYIVAPGETEAVLVVERGAPLDRKLTLRYFTVADSAQPGIDYVGYQYVGVVLPAGQSRARISIPLLQVQNRRRPVAFDVHLGATGNALPGRTVVARVVLPPTDR